MNNQSSIIENKLLAKDEFLQLDKLLNRFNIFEATDMVRREIKHTKFLSYLLDPNESHGLGEVFIKNFVIRISEKFEDFPRILDLDFSFAEIKPEFKFSEKAKNSLDCLVKIPFRGNSNASEIVVAIENKLDSKQGVKQLSTYKEGLEEKFNTPLLFKVYLTFNYEEPLDPSWKHITYEDVVLPAVKSTVEVLEEKGAVYLKATLNDYLELLMEDEDGDKEKDKLANELIQDVDINNYIDSLGKVKDKRESFGVIYVKHKKVIDYLCQFDSDIRTRTLEWWKKLEKTNYSFNVEGYDQKLILKYESSIRRYLRFSVLTELNRQRLSELSQTSRKWLESSCPIAFEILMIEGSQQTIKCRATLTLGPVDSRDDRLELMRFTYPKLVPGEKSRVFKDEMCNEFWNSLISTKQDEWKDGKSDDKHKPQEWIENHVLRFKDESIVLKDWIKELAVKLNQGLDDYFQHRDHAKSIIAK